MGKTARSRRSRGRASWGSPKACNSSHSEVDVTQLFDWVHQPPFNFTCKPTTLTAAPSDENYVKFRKSFNAWSDSNGGNPIKLQGRLNDDIWSAIFDLYEFNLKDELGEDPAGLRNKLAWVDDGKKSMGFGEKHPIDPKAVDGRANPADRRVEALLFDDDEDTLPKLAETNGEDVYDGVTYDKVPVEPMVSARRLFRISLEIGYDNPWTENDYLVVVDSLDQVVFNRRIGDGVPRPSRRLFEFRQYAAETKYRAEIRMQYSVFLLFDFTSLSMMQLNDSPSNSLETPVAIYANTSANTGTV